MKEIEGRKEVMEGKCKGEIGQFGKNKWPIERYTSILSKNC